MAGRIANDDIQALREQADAVEVISAYTQLKQAGTTTKGLCPFHSEKTPSFTVDRGRGLWHCFGCGEGGDIYAFLGKVEGLTFPEAVERLAGIVGYQLRYEELSPGQRKALGRRTRLAEAVEEAAQAFTEQLVADEGEAARSYLASRGLDDRAIAHFRIGWAGDRWDGLVRHLTAKGFDQREVVDAGLASQGRRGAVDRFRGRITFPIMGSSGVVAFGGRVIPGVELRTGPRDGSPAKYINSPESPVYHKSEVLYGLNWARADIVRQEAVIVVEGYMDVIGLHQAGVRHAVATCGTALTTEHFRQLERFAPQVILALDADDAGYAAADRARALAAEVGVRHLGVLPLPPGQDPADLAAQGAQVVADVLARAQTALQFQIGHLLRDTDTTSPEGAVAAYRATFPLLARIDDRFLRYTYIRDLVAPAVRLSADRIESELDAAIASGDALPQKPERASQVGPPPDASVTRMAGVASSRGPRDPQLWIEREVLRAALQLPDLLPAEWDEVEADDFTHPASRALFAALRASPSGDLDAVMARMSDDDARARVRALALGDPTVTADQAPVAELVVRLRARRVERDIAATRAALVDVNRATDPGEHRALASLLVELQQRWHGMRDGVAG